MEGLTENYLRKRKKGCAEKRDGREVENSKEVSDEGEKHFGSALVAAEVIEERAMRSKILGVDGGLV